MCIRDSKSLAKAAKEGAAEELAKKVPFGLGKKKKQEEKPLSLIHISEPTRPY